jgi:beta-glucanase (GH16 family)
LNTSVWSVRGNNYYATLTHWSKNDVIVGNGFAKLRYEKKAGFQNDDPQQPSTPYAAGYLDTYGLWTQRYGYFETRVKVPSAPGLWPAFWMMPDRGEKAGPEQWKRQDTANGGMEFDVMEHLSRWGTHRFNIAMHYDGYQKDHKQLGSEKMYAEPDKDGFVTFGLLWLPGLAQFYYNGTEVLRWKNPRISSVPETLMFTLPMGGWDNNDLDDKTLPADMLIDYVRVWQLRQYVAQEGPLK